MNLVKYIYLILFFLGSFSAKADLCLNFEKKLNELSPVKNDGSILDGQIEKKDLGLFFQSEFISENNEIKIKRDQNNYPELKFSILNDAIPPKSSILSINENDLSNIPDDQIYDLNLSNTAVIKIPDKSYTINSQSYHLYAFYLESFKINAIDEIKTKEGQFKLDYSFVVSTERPDWIEAGREIGNLTSCNLDALNLENFLYYPIEQTDFLTQFDFDEDKVTKSYDQIYNIESDKTVSTAYYSGVANIKADFNLKNFPFDHQYLRLELTAPYNIDLDEDEMYGIKSISTISPKKSVYYDLNSYKKNNFLKEWKIIDVKVKNDLELTESASMFDDEKIMTYIYDKIIIDILVDRNTNYFIFKIIIPVFLILAIAWSVMWIPPNQVESRLTTSIVALLALIAYNFVFNEDLPKLSYLTSLDRYILLSYLFCAIPTFLTIYFSRLTKKEYNIALNINKKSRLLGIVIYGLTTAFIFSS